MLATVQVVNRDPDPYLDIYTVAYLYILIYMPAYRHTSPYVSRRDHAVMTQHTRLKPHWFHILLSLSDTDLHGTAIMEEVLDRTDRQLRLWPGKLYGALRDMADAGLISEVDAPAEAPTEGGKRRFYGITRKGRLALHEEVERLAMLVRIARAKGAGGDPA
jgi:DNA-binding PadR family transcriptional regulator